MFLENIFSNRLKELRAVHNLTLKKLGLKVGATKATIGNLENSNKKPSLDLLIALADYFDVSLDYLVGRSDTNSSLNKAVMQTNINSHTEELKDIYNSLDDDYKELLIRRARQIANMAANDLTKGMDKDA